MTCKQKNLVAANGFLESENFAFVTCFAATVFVSQQLACMMNDIVSFSTFERTNETE